MDRLLELRGPHGNVVLTGVQEFYSWLPPLGPLSTAEAVRQGERVLITGV
jgi:hypothetical protein